MDMLFTAERDKRRYCVLRICIRSVKGPSIFAYQSKKTISNDHDFVTGQSIDLPEVCGR